MELVTYLASYQESEFRHIGCSLTSCVMTWWGHIVERWCLCQDARLQETKHGCITNQTLPHYITSFTRASGRSNSKQQMCCVFREVQAVQKSESGGQRQKPAKAR